MEQQLALLLVVVEHIQAAVESCTSSLVSAQQAQQLQDKLQLLRAAVISAEAGAGRLLFFFSKLWGRFFLWTVNFVLP